MTIAADLLTRMARDAPAPVIGEFGLYALARKLFQDRGYAGTPIPPRNHVLTERSARRLIDQATSNRDWPFDPPATGRLPRDPDFTSRLYMTRYADAAEVMLTADPFCCLSHASALAFHGLARSPAELHVLTPDRANWMEAANRNMEAILGFPPEEAESDELPFRMTPPNPLGEVRGTKVYRHEGKDSVAATANSGTRATGIGHTFRDTLDKPAWCGGIAEVVRVWRDQAAAHRDAIIAAIDASPEKIVRVRAGYLMDEVLGIADPRIDAWQADAQRGSSRKLDAAAPYASTFSARWMLSINVTSLDLPSTSKP